MTSKAPTGRVLIDDTRVGEAVGVFCVWHAGPDELLLIVLQRDRAGTFGVHHARGALDAELAAFPCATLHGLARTAWTAAAASSNPGVADAQHGATTASQAAPPLATADRFALEMFERLWDQALDPLLARLAAQGITQIDLVPSGDLHVVPWNHLADRHAAKAGAPFRLRVFPGTGAWWRVARRDDGTRVAHTAPRSPQWALVAAPSVSTGGDALPWLVVERALSEQLWADAIRRLASA